MERKCNNSSRSKRPHKGKGKVGTKGPKQDFDKGSNFSSIGLSTPHNSSRSSIKKGPLSKLEVSIQFSEEARNPQNSSIKEVEYDDFTDSDDELGSFLGIAGSSGKCSKSENSKELCLQEEQFQSFLTDSNNIQNLGFNDGHKSDWFCEEIKESLKEVSTENDQDLSCLKDAEKKKKQESLKDFEEPSVYTGEKIFEAFEKVERMVIKQVEKGKKIKDSKERLKSLINKVKGVSENRKFVDLWMRCIRCLDILKCEDDKLKDSIEKENWDIEDQKKKLADLNNLYFSQLSQNPEIYVTALEENSQEKKEIQNEVLISDLIKEERNNYGCAVDMSFEREKRKLIEEDESYFADDDKTFSTAQKNEPRTFGLELTNKKPSPYFRTIPLASVFRGTDISGLKRKERDVDDVEYENALEEELSSIRKMMRTEATAQVLPHIAGSQETKSSDYLTRSTECPPAEQRGSLDFTVEANSRNEDTSKLTFEGLNRLNPPPPPLLDLKTVETNTENERGIEQEHDLSFR